jgi:hypothetical protein
VPRYVCTPPAGIRLGRYLIRENAERAIEAAYADGIAANTRAARIMTIIGSVQIVDIVARAISCPTGDALARDTHWLRQGGMARELHQSEARAALAALRSTIEADDAAT